MVLTDSKHITRQFDADLEHIFSLLLTMGSLVEKQLNDGLAVVRGDDNVSAKNVIANDSKVNAMEVAIDEACVTLIARRQPLAQDLRFIIVVLKMASELERIGDAVDRLCRTALEDNVKVERKLLGNLEVMAEDVIGMLSDVLKAFKAMDLEAATSVYHHDKKVNEQCDKIMKQSRKALKSGADNVDNILSAIFTARALERIGDRNQNICEFIYYYLKGKDVRRVEENVF